MKKFICIFVLLFVCVSFVACDGSASQGDDASVSQSDGTSAYETFDSMEYSVYVNIFYNGLGEDYENKTYTKEGIFGILQDEYNNTTRYYVWGYADQTKCCDYQWEVVLDENAQIPVPGSFVKFTGTLLADESALDGYWFTDVSLEVVNEKAKTAFDYDLTTLSPTLARVQIINMLAHPDVFDSKTVNVYARVLDADTIQHPYYDEAWELDCKGELQGTVGNYVTVSGTFTADSEDSYLQIG